MEWSSHCSSSTASRIGPASARASSSDSNPVATARGSGDATNHSTTSAAYLRCGLLWLSGTPDTYAVLVPPGGSTAVPVQGVLAITGSSSIVQLYCRKGSSVTMSIDENPQLTAIKVGALG